MQKPTSRVQRSLPERGLAAERDDGRWAAVVARDSARAGEFYFSVASTGIYCRAGCPARLPRRDNVAFYATADAAEAAGFRPCKRCKPREAALDERRRDSMLAACRTIEAAETEPTLAELARASGLSAHHFHRLFRSIVGVTPKAYAMAHRQKQVRDKLKRSQTVTEAIHASGFNSSGRFYADSNAALGMTPTAYRAGGTNTTIRYALAPSSLGQVLVAASDKGVCAIFFGDDGDALVSELRQRFPKADIMAGDHDFDALTAKVVAFVEAPETSLDLPLDIRGTAFQHRVWQALREIPSGETVTYADIAARIGSPKAVRAVGAACGANPIAVAVPCHRVLRKDGNLPDENYRWGGKRKRALLAKEKRG
jgi:AraC family transcriptional regulator of adaptative response/methylated-DNA-[protein]-cysteine methyltransferase